MKRIATILLVLFLFPFIVASGQDDKFQSDITASNDNRVERASASNTGGQADDLMGGSRIARLPGERSGMYLNTQFESGSVGLAGGSVMDPLSLRYDLYFQQIQFLKDGDTLAFSRPGELSKVEIGRRKFDYVPYIEDGSLDSSWFEVVSEGRCRLLRRHFIKYHIVDDDKSPEDDFIYSTRLFIQKPGQPATAIRQCRRDVCCTFSDRKDEVKDFIKTNNLRMRKTEDLILVVEFYNNLVAER